MSFTNSLSGGGRHGVASTEKRAPIGYAVAVLNRFAQSALLDRVGLRKQAESAVFSLTRGGFKAVGAAARAFKVSGSPAQPGERPAATRSSGTFDLTPTEDEQMLVEVSTDFASQALRPAAAAANESCAAPVEVLTAGAEIGLPILGLPESLGGLSEERSAMASALVAEALAHGDMGLAVASLASGTVATAIGLWGNQQQQQTYLPAFAGNEPPVASLALAEPRPLFDAGAPATTAVRDGANYRLSGVKSGAPRGGEAELFVVSARLDGAPALFLVEGGAAGLRLEGDPSMGVRAAGMARVHLDDTPAQLLGEAHADHAANVRECIRLARLGWCALALGTGQAVLDYVTEYVNTREAFGEPISHRQAVAFMVADIAIELQAMRLMTYRAASRVAAGKDATREIALAREACGRHGMKIGLDGVQLLGGHGFVKEHPVERWYRDLRAVGLMEGAVLV